MKRLDMPRPKQDEVNERTALVNMENRKEFSASTRNVLSAEASSLSSTLFDCNAGENEEGDIHLEQPSGSVTGDCFEVTNAGAVKITHSHTTALPDGRAQQPPNEAFEKEAIFVHGGKKTFCYLPADNKWYMIPGPCSEHQHSKEYQMILFQGKVHVVKSALSNQRNISSVERFDPSSVNGWIFLDWNFASLVCGVCLAPLVVLGDEIYAVEDQLTFQVSIKKLDIESNSVESVLFTLPLSVFGACVVALDSHLYIIGGHWQRKESRNCILRATKYAGRFDTVNNEWQEIASLQQPRFSACGVAAQGKVFIAGGLTFVNNQEFNPQLIKSCEVYDASTNEWQFIASLKAPRSDASMLCVEGTLYVVGGVHDFKHTMPALSIERYDPEKSKWKKKTKIPAKTLLPWKKSRVMFKACAQKVFEGVTNKPTSNGDYSRLS